jgi:HEAT repeat protein
MTEELALTLQAALRDADSQDPRYRLAAAERLWGTHEENAQVLPTIRRLSTDEMGPIRHVAFLALREACDPDDIILYEEGLSDGYLPVQQVSLQGLVALGAPLARERVEEWLNADSEAYRETAVYALADGWPEEASRRIEIFLTDANMTVRLAAAQTLAELADPESRNALAAALSDEDSAVRRSISQALAKLGDRRALPGLLEALGTASELADRLACLEDLGNLGEADAIPHLDQVARRPLASLMERAGAGASLHRLGSAEGQKYLRAVLRAWRSYARPYAVSLIGEHRIAALEPELRRLQGTRGAPENLTWALNALAGDGAEPPTPLESGSS